LFSLTLSSVVAFSEGHRVIGVAAKERHVSNISNTITSVKRHMGLEFSQNLLQQELILHSPASLTKVYAVKQRSRALFQVCRYFFQKNPSKYSSLAKKIKSINK
jgi:molecular chaperone DnaK (HSP70)